MFEFDPNVITLSNVNQAVNLSLLVNTSEDTVHYEATVESLLQNVRPIFLCIWVITAFHYCLDC